MVKLDQSEMRVVVNALVMMEKSVSRLAAKEGQPEGVKSEYLKARSEIVSLLRKYEDALDGLLKLPPAHVDIPNMPVKK